MSQIGESNDAIVRMMEREIEDLETQLKDLEQAFMKIGNWQPISTIPDNGVVWVKNDQYAWLVYIGSHRGEKRLYDSYALVYGNYIRVSNATHWLVD